LNYLEAFLGRGQAEKRGTPPLTKLTKLGSVSFVRPMAPLVSAGGGMAPDVLATALGTREPCQECGRTDWTISLVHEGGERTCGDCASGLTALRRRGVPI
jgi:hypothetical protein